MLPESTRRRLGDGNDTTLIAGFATLRRRLDDARVDALVIIDTHWFTTSEHRPGTIPARAQNAQLIG